MNYPFQQEHIKQMESKNCTQCETEKRINNFYKKSSEGKRGLKRYCQNKDKISNHRKNYYEKNRTDILQEQNNRYIKFKELIRSYIELENRL